MQVRRFAAGVAVAVVATVSLCQPVLAAYEVPPNDGLITQHLNEGTVVLTPQEADSLKAELIAYDRQTSNQIAIVILQNLNGYPIEDVGLEIGRKWGVGSSRNNGILIVFSYDDRQVRIEVGYGLEGAVPDIVASGIIEEDMIPFFREKNYYGGFKAAFDSLQKHIGGEYTAERYAAPSDDPGAVGYLAFFGFILLQWIFSILSRTKSWWLGGVFGAVGGIILVVIFGWWLSIPLLTVLGLALDYVVSKNYKSRGRTAWWAGGGFGPGSRGGSSGGFGGFGGGSFGGGGASGRW